MSVLHLVPPIEGAPEKVCRVCGSDKLTEARILHRDYLCSECTKKQIRQWETEHPDEVRARQTRNKQRYRLANPEKVLWSSARARALEDGVPFDIEVRDILIPPCCPVLGIPLKRNPGRGGGDASPSLDRIIPSKGYVRGNVAVISNRANRIKSNATLEELERVWAWVCAVTTGGA